MAWGEIIAYFHNIFIYIFIFMLVVLKRYKPFFFGAISEWLEIFFEI